MKAKTAPPSRTAVKFLNLFLLLVFILQLAFYIQPSSAKEFQPAGNIFWLDLKKKLVPYLNSQIDSSKYRYEIVGPTKQMTNFLGFKKDAAIRFSKINLSGMALRRSVFASAKVTGKPDDFISIILNVYKYKKVYVLKHAVKRGDVIDFNNINQVTQAINPSMERLFVVEKPFQKVATVDIAAGIGIKRNMVRHELLINQGEMLKVTSGSKTIQLEFNCKALNGGDMGDEINILCPELQKKKFRGIITGPGNVKLI